MRCNIADAVDDLRQIIARAEALATASEGLLDNVFEVNDEDDRRRLERLAHLVSATVSAVQAAQEAGDDLASALIQRPPTT